MSTHISKHSTDVIRALLRAKYGERNFRITEDGAIHVKAVMPNTNRLDWWLWGDIGAADTEARLDRLHGEFGEEGGHD